MDRTLTTIEFVDADKTYDPHLATVRWESVPGVGELVRCKSVYYGVVSVTWTIRPDQECGVKIELRRHARVELRQTR